MSTLPTFQVMNSSLSFMVPHPSTVNYYLFTGQDESILYQELNIVKAEVKCE